MTGGIYQLCSRPGCRKRRPEGVRYLADCSQCLEAKQKREDRYKRIEEGEGYESLPFYKSFRWQKLRKAILLRDPMCTICMRQWATIAHHLKPARDYPDLIWDTKNLVGVCASCHRKETQREIAERKKS